MRLQWRALLDARIIRRELLIDEGFSKQQIRAEREYRRLKKEQTLLGVKICHLEKKVQHARAASESAV